MNRGDKDWRKKYKEKDALWIHDENPKRPHALLTSGNHSNGFFNSRLVIPDEKLLREAASDLLELLSNTGELEGFDIDMVVGPQTGATKLAELISNHVKSYTGEYCSWASPAKCDIDGKRTMVFRDEDLRVLSGKSVLLCEDVLTTGGSVDRTVDAVANAGGIILPFILTLVNRSRTIEISGKKIISLINHHMPIWTPDECPLCKKGSEAIHPKGREEWLRLNAVMSRK